MAAVSPNRLLSSLAPEAFEFLRPHLKPVELVQGTVLVEGGGEIAQVYFPHGGIISMVVRLETGATVEVAMVGSDGLFGAFAALDGKISLNTAIIQLSGNASVLETSRLRAAADQSAPFRALLMRHEQVIFAQALQSAACNASHTVQARLSRWLLRARDLSGSDTLSFTQEFLAQMLGTQRNSVSIVANTLQQAGLIRYHRGHIEITNAEGLLESSCECYGTVKAYYDKLLRGR
ncbi:Crp/Fnr family transcriptional regulator [Mesorhizobium huakuii]|uniref:Crp/Fnr family transcriptional regulator n=1 Tax=Mesorhizobium huakuii TaxID=28104 RepID=UPI00235BD1B6|nr:Crp/Fnr family transcriptional regulator [Mesorhizobium huakuii]GLQ77273.1 Crp/Fnr family transcriptional regulator [Mesorhizobium huakuii]